MLTVLILAAGYGRRMGPFSRMVNKGLVPYDNKPLISHIIEKFDHDVKFVIAVGHMGQQVKDYVNLVHADKNITFVDITDYSEGTTGPATTIQICSEYITGPMMWLSCDTLFDFDYKSKMDHNWIGVHPVDSSIAKDYCWVKRDDDLITCIKNKEPSKQAVDAFIGLMYCKDATFVENLKTTNAKEIYEGLLDNLDLRAYTVREWYDFGTYDKWEELSRDLQEVSFPKPDELFYSDNKKIIKFTVDKDLAEKKYNRALLNLRCMPKNVTVSNQFLAYDYANGNIVYDILTPDLFSKMLSWAEIDLWRMSKCRKSAEVCKKFYFDKTKSRLKDFRIKYSNWDEPRIVNGIRVDGIDDYLDNIDWEWLFNTTEWCFVHGDFQFENLVYNDNDKKFTCIDWRTDFGGENNGDLYYDLAKMAGGICLNYQAVKAGKLSYVETDSVVELNDCSITDADLYLQKLKYWCDSRKLDYRKVQLLIPIIYLNMSPLHEAPFDKYLYSLAQYYFSRFFNEYPRSN